MGDMPVSWQKAMRTGQCSTTPLFEVDFRDELVKRVRRKIEAESFQEVRPFRRNPDYASAG